MLVNERLYNVLPPGVTVGAVPEQFIWDVPALNVRLIDCVNTTGVAPLNVSVLDPSDIVRTLGFVDDREPAVTVKFLVSKAPLVTVRVLAPMFSASASSTEFP